MIEIKQNLVSQSKYSLKCPYSMVPVGICVHNTANDGSAAGEISYMRNNLLSTSFHFAVDDLGAVQGLPLDRNGWHAGDGTNGTGNRKYIAIEICYSKSGGARFDKAEQNAAELIASLLKQYNWGIECVKKHQDFSGKYCPHRTLDQGWERYLSIIKSKLNMAADMYGTPLSYDLSNRDSMKVIIDAFNDFMTPGKYIKAVDSEQKLTAQKEQYESKITELNGLMKGLQDQIKELVEDASTHTGTLPETITIAGATWKIGEVILVKL